MDVNKMIAVVQLYIGMRKDVSVDIRIESITDLSLLIKAYNIANNWMVNNNVDISVV